ncbi:MAG: radical SAM protein [Actinomycetota bacterium]
MKITLISFDSELFCVGLRLLSSCLKQKNHEVNCLFLSWDAYAKNKSCKFQIRYTEKLLNNIGELCRDSDLIGMSLMTNQFMQAVQVTEYLKKSRLKAPIIWGGIEPTVEPKTCLEYADIVCLGEGEETLLELVEKMEKGNSFRETKNIWLKSGKEIICNPVRPLVENINAFPLPDYSCQDHYLANADRIEPLTRERIIKFKGERFRSSGGKVRYPIMTSRGCPFICSYCCNSVYERLYVKQKRLRFRSAENVISELEMIREQLGPLDFVYMVDDNFTARSSEDLNNFCELYKQKIGVSFYCQVSPLTINEEKINILIKYGCVKVTMGVETGSERIAVMYNRGNFHKVTNNAIALLEKYRKKMRLPPSYQFIIDNPYETLDETVQTLKLALSIKKPWDSPIFSLMLFPGTPLYEKALVDGFIKDKYSQIYGKNWLNQSKPFFQLWIRLYRKNYPVTLLRILLHPWVLLLMTNNLANAVWKTRIFRCLWNRPE